MFLSRLLIGPSWYASPVPSPARLPRRTWVPLFPHLQPVYHSSFNEAEVESICGYSILPLRVCAPPAAVAPWAPRAGPHPVVSVIACAARGSASSSPWRGPRRFGPPVARVVLSP